MNKAKILLEDTRDKLTLRYDGVKETLSSYENRIESLEKECKEIYDKIADYNEALLELERNIYEKNKGQSI